MTLTVEDVDRHARLGIDVGLLTRAGVRRVTDREARELLNMNGRRGDMSGVVYPYVWPGTAHPIGYRVRRDHPEVEKGKPKDKYLSGAGDRKHLYFHCDEAVCLDDAAVPIIVVEAEKSVLSVASVALRQARPLVAIGLGGAWGFRGRIGKVLHPNGGTSPETGILPDFDRLVWRDRIVVLAFDANAAHNADVQRARSTLATELRSRGADVRILDLPVEPGINGPDDYIGQHGDAAFLALLDAAVPYEHGAQLTDFYAYMPAHQYLFAPSRVLWPAGSVNARVPWPTVLKTNTKTTQSERTPIPPADWLDRHRAVEQMTWAPGLPLVIDDRLIDDGGWFDRPGCHVFNLYRPAPHLSGDASQAAPWIEHVYRLYPAEANHLITWLAHRVQRPAEKINHAIVLGGLQGIGKDSLLQPVAHAIGTWNMAEISPSQILGRFNGYVKSVILRINEGRDLGDVDRYAFYERLKLYTAAPPDVLRVDEKNLREYHAFNACGVILTTNHKTDGMYLPADDRRHAVAWADVTRDDFDTEYFPRLYRWYAEGGIGHVAAYLRSLDLSQWNAKAPPPKTDAFWAIVDANRAPEDAELGDVLDRLGTPDAVTLDELIERADASFADWLRDRSHRRQIPHRLEEAGYAAVRNPGRPADGLWTVNRKRQVVYARRSLTPRDRILAARELCGEQ